MGEHWALYIRVSTRQQVDGFSLADQTDKLTAYAKSQGWRWTIFEDPGVSGERLADRPGLSALLEAVDRDDVHGVIVLDESRLARDDLVAAQIRDKFKRAGVLLATPTRGVLDLNEPTEKFMASVIAAAHAFDQDLRRTKMISGLRRTAEAGHWPGGTSPYGYRLVPSEDQKHTVLAINDEEAHILQRATSLILNDGLSTYKATRQLNALGLLTRSKTPWSYRNLLWQLRKPHLTGTLTYNAVDGPISIEIPAIIDQPTWSRLQTAIRGKATGKPTKRKSYPLTGHLDCPCGGHLSGFPKPNKRKYKCSRNSIDWGDKRCDQYPRYRDAEELETAVWDEVKKVITDPGYLTHLLETHLAEQSPSTHLSHDQRSSLKRRIAGLRREQVTITREYASTGIDANVLRTAIDAIAADIETLEEQLDRAEHWEETRKMKSDAVASLTALAERATETLAWPTPELMKEVFDLLDIRVLETPDGLQIHGVIPIGAWDEDDVAVGQLRTGALQDPAPHRQRSDRAADAGPP